MSMSVSALSGALSSLQSLLQQDPATAGGAADGTDPISMLLKSLSGSDNPASQVGAAAESTAKAAGAGCGRFSADTLSSLISMQGQQASGAAAGGSGVASADADSAASSTDTGGVTTVTTTNADGSTTTTTTYADGFELAATIPAAPSSSTFGGGTSGNASNPQASAEQFAQWLETQAQALLPAAGSLLALI
jgi:hypothetical protein